MTKRDEPQPLRTATDHAVTTPVWKRLQQVTIKLTDAHGELAETLKAEKDARAQVYREQEASSISALDRTADLFALELHKESLDQKADIAALEEERDFLRLLITHGPVKEG